MDSRRFLTEDVASHSLPQQPRSLPFSLLFALVTSSTLINYSGGRGGGGGGEKDGEEILDVVEDHRREAEILPFGLQVNDPEGICQQALHFTGQSSLETSTLGNDTLMMMMMMKMMTTTTKNSATDEERLSSKQFFINVNVSKYIPGHVITVTVSGQDEYRGFLLQARRHGSTVAVGSFPTLSISNNQTEVRLFNCDGPSDTLLAWFAFPVANKSFSWMPTEEEFERVQFLGTVYADERNFYANVTSKTFRKGFRSIDLDGCGKLKGCFRYTNEGSITCDADTCQYLVTYNVTGGEAQFELSAMADWVAIAFSSDDRMGGDDVFMCIRRPNRWTVDVRRYVTEVGYQTPIQKETNPLYDAQGEVGDDDRVSCRFRRPLKVAHEPDLFSIDLSNSWYQLYAWGEISNSGAIMRHVLDRPPTSSKKLTLRASRNEFMTGSASLRSLPSSLLRHHFSDVKWLQQLLSASDLILLSTIIIIIISISITGQKTFLQCSL